MSTLFISSEDVVTLTGKIRYSAQIRALAKMGIECHTRPDGRPIVLLDDVRHLMPQKHKKKSDPDFGALDSVA